MEKAKKVERFVYIEKLLYKVTFILLGTSVFLFAFTFFIIGSFQTFGKALINITFTMFIVSGLHFFLNILRILKYFFRNNILQNDEGIWRSLMGLVLTPVTFSILYILMIVLTFSSCAVSI